MHALAFCRWGARNGLPIEEIAERLGITVRTLQRWQGAWRTRHLDARGRGRPASRAEREVRQRALAVIGLLGPGVGVPTLQALCPAMARREIQDLLRRYRRVWRRRNRLVARILHWTRPGTVWAADFAEPPAPVDGAYPQLLAVRDLASGFQLLWLPAPDACAKTAIGALRSLFRQHGPPLVLKTDNGSPFIAEEFKSRLRRHGVWQLYSPPDLPRYNGSCEAGIGSMKARTHNQAVRRGYPGEWTCEDVEAARLQANETARPWGHQGPTPEKVWRSRKQITARERQAFTNLVRQFLRELTRGDTPPDAAAHRKALANALVRMGLLEFTSASVPRPFPARTRR